MKKYNEIIDQIKMQGLTPIREYEGGGSKLVQFRNEQSKDADFLFLINENDEIIGGFFGRTFMDETDSDDFLDFLKEDSLDDANDSK